MSSATYEPVHEGQAPAQPVSRARMALFAVLAPGSRNRPFKLARIARSPNVHRVSLR